MKQRGLHSIKLTRGMLLMQYNDNIPAVFGFPPVIPHQRRGMKEEDRRKGGVYCSWQCLAVFVLSSISPLFPQLFLSSLLPPSLVRSLL